jgi:uncharacterized protein
MLRIIPQKIESFYASRLRRLEDQLIRERFGAGVHLLENSDQGIIFFRDDISVYSCPKPLKRAIENFLAGIPRSTACLNQGVRESDFDHLLHSLLSKLESRAEQTEKNPQPCRQGHVLDRLVLNISNACNLKCRYCYAGGGNYHLPNSLMDRRTAAGILDQFYRLFARITKIQFFGGEPLLNADLIEFVCQDCRQRQKRGEIEELPKFGVVTNGTIFSPEIIDLFKRHDISPTISLDGPEAVNDDLRGRGTYDKIRQLVRSLEKNQIGYSFEGTYTAHHLKAGLSLCDLLNFYHERFGQSEVHVPLVSLPLDHPLAISDGLAARMYRQAVEYSLENLKNGRSSCCLSFASRMMNAYSEAKPVQNYCPAGISTLAVDSMGSVYPCFMFIGRPEFNLGNVLDQDFPDGTKVREIGRKLWETDKSRALECQECWASPFCSGCLGADYIRTRGTLAKTSCHLTREMAEGFLSQIADLIVKKPERIHRFSVNEGGDSSCDNMF